MIKLTCRRCEVEVSPPDAAEKWHVVEAAVTADRVFPATSWCDPDIPRDLQCIRATGELAVAIALGREQTLSTDPDDQGVPGNRVFAVAGECPACVAADGHPPAHWIVLDPKHMLRDEGEEARAWRDWLREYRRCRGESV